MSIDSVKITIPDFPAGRLLAFAEVVISGFVVHEIKVLQSNRADGECWLAMPQVMVEDKCPRCVKKNWVMARYCMWCGNRLKDDRVAHRVDGSELRLPRGDPQLFSDQIHPKDETHRALLHHAVFAEYDRVLRLKDQR